MIKRQGSALHFQAFVAPSAIAVLLACGSANATAPAQKLDTAGKPSKPTEAPARPPSAPTFQTPGPSKAEADHTKRLDAALGPTLGLSVVPEDARLIRDAIAATAAGDPSKHTALAAQITAPAARKLVEWHRLRSGRGSAQDYKAFLDRNPAWPDRALLTRRMEEDLFARGGSASELKAFFANRAPASGAGLGALASAHLANGDTAEAEKLVRKAWRDESFPAVIEQGFVQRFGKLLSAEDHKWRFDRLLTDELRWRAERGERAAIARRVIPLMTAAEQKRAEARLAVFNKAGNARKLMDALPADQRTDWGLAFHQAQVLRQSERAEEAAKLVLTVPARGDATVNPDGWWGERRALAYGVLKAGKPKLAYDLVRDAGALSANPLKEQRFMAGWLALRHLKDVPAARTHFNAMREAADGPLSRAKANYWLGRVEDAAKEPQKAREHYRRAVAETDTFHGFLARQRLEPSQRSIEIAAPAAPSPDTIADFNGLDAVQALVIAKKAGLDGSISRAFLLHLGSTLKSEAEVAMTAHLADALGDTQTGVRIAKTAAGRGMNLLYYSYPVHPFPAYTPLRQPPETAFLLGVARQETEFNTLTVSGAGAKGLLQVMAITAKHVCRDYKLTCELDRLLKDKPYNTMLASAYIADRMAEFSGSYVLALAGYNAGPGRARQWIREFGDPRDPAVDPIDWIERIPFQETREYVAKVLSNIQVYRARIGDGRTALQLDDDLARGQTGAKRAAEARN